MKIKELNKSKTPIVRIDKSLEKLRGKNLFPEKLAEANEVLAKVGLPKTKHNQPTNETAKSETVLVK
ncbi:MAG: hypothetical protein ACR2J3_03660 [Aridibacter sp.]